MNPILDNHLWVRDNSDWFFIYDKEGCRVASAHWEQFHSNISWDDPGELSDEERSAIEKALTSEERYIRKNVFDVDALDYGIMKVGEYEVEKYDPDW